MILIDILAANRIANNIIKKKKYTILEEIHTVKNKKELNFVEVDLKIKKFCRYSFKNKQCLHISLMLYIILVRHGYNPEFIIGVSTRPFMSHAWIEVDNKVVNDHCSIKNIYVPILRIGGN